MEKIQVKNLRSLKDTGEIEINKVNILVGTNSSGKSTFLRVFPLLKQSFNKKINGPILWCGDEDDYVDFGSFEEAVNYNAENECIQLLMECSISLDSYRINHYIETVKLDYTIRHSEKNGYDYISELKYSFKTYCVDICFSEQNQVSTVYINGEQIELKKNKALFKPLYDLFLFELPLLDLRYIAKENLKELLDIKNNEEDVEQVLENYVNNIYIVNVLQRNKIDYAEKYMLDNFGEKRCDIEKWMILYLLPIHYSEASKYLKNYFNRVYYITATRMTMARYYRLRNLSVNEIDCSGKNLPIFLNSLSESRFSEFQNWTQENFGFKIIKKTSEGHISLKIKTNGQKKEVNLLDSGFGYSQILPIVTQLWYIVITGGIKIESERTPEKQHFTTISEPPITVVVEEPELHLHPGLQAKLMDVIVKVAQQSNIKFIIETHSETMINRMGAVIDAGKIDNEDVWVIIFEKDEDDNTVVTKGGFDKEGYLENWPIGFFEPEGV